MYEKAKSIILFALLLVATYSSAQVSVSVYGSVKDKLGEPIGGASVFLEGTELGAQTNFDGNYEIRGVAPGS